MTLVNLVYISERRLSLGSGPIIQQINTILASSIRNNAALEVTGALVFDDTRFVQVLEGERDAVWDTFRRVEQDGRHAEVGFVAMDAVARRYFGNWWMRCAERNRQTAATFAPYLRGGQFQPADMSRSELLSLMLDLSQPDRYGRTGYSDERFIATDGVLRTEGSFGRKISSNYGVA